jgi:ribosomal protein S2
MIRRTEALRTIPEALFLLNIKQNLPLLRNSIKLQIPVIGVINSDADPLGIQYPIPANDAEHLGIYKDLALGAFEECTQSEPKFVCGPAKP